MRKRETEVGTKFEKERDSRRDKKRVCSRRSCFLQEANNKVYSHRVRAQECTRRSEEARKRERESVCVYFVVCLLKGRVQCPPENQKGEV